MAVKTESVILGNNTNDTYNFLLDTDLAGALRIRRKSDGSGGLLMSIDSSGIPRDKDGLDMRPLGVGQTWQNMTASRALGTTYTNNTGRTIKIRVGVTATSNASSAVLQPAINGGNLPSINMTESNGTIWNSPAYPLSLEVPPNSTYIVTFTNATLASWWELRT